MHHRAVCKRRACSFEVDGQTIFASLATSHEQLIMRPAAADRVTAARWAGLLSLCADEERFDVFICGLHA